VKEVIPFDTAVRYSVVILVTVILFNLAVGPGLAPSDIVWGGRLTGREEVILFELISVLLNVFSISLIWVKAGRISSDVVVSKKSINPHFQ
jgi:hypothetical protein